MRRSLSILLAPLALALGLRAGPPGLDGARFIQGAPPARAPGAPPSQASEFFRTLLSSGDAHQTRVRLVTDNVQAWALRWALVEGAEETLDVTYFVFDDDIFGRSFLGLLHKKAQMGVKVRLMIDAIGGKKIVGRGHAYLRALADLPNAEVKVFNPKLVFPRRLIPSIRNVISSNHDKILMADGRRAITGGRNIGWHYFADPADRVDTFQDTDVVLEGEAISGEFQRAFTEEWERRKAYDVKVSSWFGHEKQELELGFAYHAMRRWLMGGALPDMSGGHPDLPHADMVQAIHDELEQYPSSKGSLNAVWERVFQGQRAYPTRILDKHGRFGRKDEIKRTLIKLIDTAEESIMFQNPYVILRKDIAAALRRAAFRGVKLFLHTNGPGSTNHLITQAYFLKDWKLMMRSMPTLRIFVSKPGRTLHSKTFVIDGEVASVGTYNLDPLSTDINSELIALVESRDFAERLSLRMLKDMSEGIEYQVRRNDEGILEEVVGPSQEASGRARALLAAVRKIPFLRSLL